MPISTVKDLCSYLERIEDDFSLFERTIDGVSCWQIIRMDVYYTLAQKLNILEKPHAQNFANRSYTNLFNGLLKYNPFFASKPVHTVILEHKRSISNNGRIVDIYTEDILDESKSKGVTALDRPFNNNYSKPINSYRYHCEAIDLLYYLAKLFLPKTECISFADVSKRISNDTGIEVNLDNLARESFRRFKYKKLAYKYLLKHLSPKELYLTVSYYNLDIISAAQDLGILVKEIQHGTFSDYHMGYHFKSNRNLILPDEFYCWSDSWKIMSVLPISADQIKVRPFKFLEDKINKFKNTKKEKAITIISQGALSKQLANLMLRELDRFSAYHIYYKLHPGEFDSWKDNPALVEISNRPNVSICLNENIHHLLAISEIQIGTFSTAIFEGELLGCQTILCDLPGIEYMEQFIQSGRAKEILKP
jgi:hypothetical protein